MDGMEQGSQSSHDLDRKLSRQEASHAVTGLGWRLVLGDLRTEVLTGSLPLAADVAARAAALPHAAGAPADRHPRGPGPADAADRGGGLGHAARRGAGAADHGPGGGVPAEHPAPWDRSGSEADEAGTGRAGRSVQVLEIAIDVLDAAKVRPFWQAVLGYVDQPGQSGPMAGLIDPLGQGPAFWFQQMDEPRPQRNRIHFDVSVPHDEAHQRIQDTIAAGGTLLSDAEAPAFWILADAEGNEACICTWQGRDSR